MARPIKQIERHIPTEVELQAQSLGLLIKALTDNTESILKMLEIVKELDRAGVLDIADAALKNRIPISAIGIDMIEGMNLPPLIKNAFTLVQVLGKLDPKELEKLIKALGAGLDHLGDLHADSSQQLYETDKPSKVGKKNSHSDDHPPGMLGLLGMMRDPDVRSSLSVGLQFLKAMGGELSKKEPPQSSE